MPSLLFTCPTTHHRASTGIETDIESLRKCWQRTLKVRCPYCGDVHKISVRETYINTALHDAINRVEAFV
jgi:DNA-directed RNA polymerase subunit RPC12/RpoP